MLRQHHSQINQQPRTLLPFMHRLGIWGLYVMVPLFTGNVNALVTMLANVMGNGLSVSLKPSLFQVPLSLAGNHTAQVSLQEPNTHQSDEPHSAWGVDRLREVFWGNGGINVILSPA